MTSTVQPTGRVDQWGPKTQEAQSEVDERLHILNQEAYLACLFGRADNLLVFSLFANKGKKRRSHAVMPEQAQQGERTQPSPLSKEEGRLAAQICKNDADGSWKKVKEVVAKLEKDVPMFRSDEKKWSACLQQ
jgi:hypothetical protein